MSRPAASQASAQRIPSPPALVSTATRRPFSSGWFESSVATSTSSSSEDARITPAWWKSASTADLGAGQRSGVRARRLLPGRRRPLLSARIGLVRATRRASRPKRRGLPNDSTYISTTSVASSSSHHSRRSLVETSALLPIEMNADRPSPRDSAASSSARPSAPLCDENPMLPAGAERAANVALRLGPATAMPRQLGPISRAPYERTSASSCSCRCQAFLADLGEAGRDHDESADALAHRLLSRPDDRRARKRDHGEIDRVRDLLDRASTPRTPATGSPSRLTG